MDVDIDSAWVPTPTSMPTGRGDAQERSASSRRADRAQHLLQTLGDHRASNRPTEAINGRLKALRRNAFGFPNLINYRIRSLLHCGALALWNRKSPFVAQGCAMVC
jgi:transposase